MRGYVVSLSALFILCASSTFAGAGVTTVQPLKCYPGVNTTEGSSTLTCVDKSGKTSTYTVESASQAEASASAPGQLIPGQDGKHRSLSSGSMALD